eukprot:SM000135S26998  [mRNA]  locus=s135:140506:146085:- [translate_table: standard]
MLREYRGQLYIPEEAFRDQQPETAAFERELAELPRMGAADFLERAARGQVALLASRGVLSPRAGRFRYWDFVVTLKPQPEGAATALQASKWAMRLEEAEAQAVLREYRGPQAELETYYTPYVEVPTQSPSRPASTISSRVLLELSLAAGLVAAVALTAGGLLAVAVLTAVGATWLLLAKVAWPLAAPLVRPAFWLALSLVRSAWGALWGLARGLAGAASTVIGIGGGGGVGAVTGAGRGLLGRLSDFGSALSLGAFDSATRTLIAIVFVVVVMAALAKFTLTRRPKDFTKWDIWQAIEFGQSKPQARVEGSTGVGFSDVAGIDDVVQELQELVSYLKDPERFGRMGTKPPHGVLLEGPPGCGKTLLAKAIAGEAGVPFYQMAGSEFVEVLVGVGAARVRDLFKRAKVNRPSVVFIDEIDALGAMRQGAAGEEGMDSYNAGTQERETTLNQLLIELDGFDTGKGVVFLGATNRMDMLDSALLRPGRFDRKIAIRPPRAQGRLEVLKVHAKNVKLAPTVDLWTYAKNLSGWSGAELAQLLQEGALLAVRRGVTAIEAVDLDGAVDRLTMGAARQAPSKELVTTEVSDSMRRMAANEAGMALAAQLLRQLAGARVEPCYRLSVVPRGESLSRVLFERLDDQSYLFEERTTLIHRLQLMLGGRAAEEVLFGRNTSTLSTGQLPNASWLAWKLVSIWSLGGATMMRGIPCPWGEEGEGSGGPLLEFEGGLYNDYGLTDYRLGRREAEETSERACALLDYCHAAVWQLLHAYRGALAKTVHVLLEQGELRGEEIDLIVAVYPPGTTVEAVDAEANRGQLPPWEALDALAGAAPPLQELEELLLPLPAWISDASAPLELAGERPQALEEDDEPHEGPVAVEATAQEVAVHDHDVGNVALDGRAEELVPSCDDSSAVPEELAFSAPSPDDAIMDVGRLLPVSESEATLLLPEASSDGAPAELLVNEGSNEDDGGEEERQHGEQPGEANGFSGGKAAELSEPGELEDHRDSPAASPALQLAEAPSAPGRDTNEGEGEEHEGDERTARREAGESENDRDSAAASPAPQPAAALSALGRDAGEGDGEEGSDDAKP